MSIKVKDKDIKVVRGKKPIRSIVFNGKCIYGENLTMYTINYPATPIGTGFKVKVNGVETVSCPTEAGVIGVFDGDDIEIRIYGLATYTNPCSSVLCGTNIINGDVFSINIAEGVNIDRATKYKFKSTSNIVIAISPAESAPKVRVNINKDEGVNSLKVSYYSSPYTATFDQDRSFSSHTSTKTYDSDYAEFTFGCRISGIDSVICNEGYKYNTKSFDNSNVLISDNQCTLHATSIKGEIASIHCPALTEGIDGYSLYIIKSDYSRGTIGTTSIYDGCSMSQVISQRNYGKSTYSLYKDDVIKIVISRRDGYKLPNINIDNDVHLCCREVKFTVQDVSTNIVINDGEKGVVVRLNNEPLETGEYVMLTVESEYNDGGMIRNPNIYVGDKISIPLHPHSRVGNMSFRKPGVGLSADGVEIIPITFNSAITYVVDNISTLTINLQQGAPREVRTGIVEDLEFVFDDEGKKTLETKPGGFIKEKAICPQYGYGEEGFYFKSYAIEYYQKKSTVSISAERHLVTDIISSFNFTHTGLITTNILTGKMTVNSDNTLLTVEISFYNLLWIADTLHKVRIYPYKIIV